MDREARGREESGEECERGCELEEHSEKNHYVGGGKGSVREVWKGEMKNGGKESQDVGSSWKGKGRKGNGWTRECLWKSKQLARCEDRVSDDWKGKGGNRDMDRVKFGRSRKMS